MATTYDNASLVMIPSGVKESKLYSIKPTDGSGDFTFSRGTDTATRVNASGLIEKERGNLVLQSNTFSTTWVNSNTTETSGQSGYDGSSDAWLLDKSAASGYIRQPIVTSGVQTLSVYAKAGTLNWMRVIADGGTSTPSTWFDLQNGVVGGADFFTIDSNIESVGGGWYRCSITFEVGTIAGVRFYPADANNDVSGTSGNIYIQDAMLNAGLVAQPYIETTTAAVYEGITDNLPRLDYSGGASCPSLLLEPSRTNKNVQSEYFNTWYTLNNQTATDNAALSPEGVQNATLLERTSSSGNSRLQSPIVSVASGASVVHSIFLKAHTANNVIMYSPQGGEGKKFDLTAGTAGDDFISAPDDYGIEPYADDWYRIWIVSTMPSTNAQCWVYIDEADTTGFYAYGFQTEEGSYPTSYIPTYGTSASRAADYAYKTGVSDLIGQTEGSAFVEFELDIVTDFDYDYPQLLSLSDGTDNNRISLFLNDTYSTARAQLYVKNGGGVQASIISASITAGKHKIAYAYANDDFVLYMDGVQIGTDSGGSVPTCSLVGLNGYSGASDFSEIKRTQALLFKTRLTNAELAALTTL